MYETFDAVTNLYERTKWNELGDATVYELSDFVTATYLAEASVRLEVASSRLIGGPR